MNESLKAKWTSIFNALLNEGEISNVVKEANIKREQFNRYNIELGENARIEDLANLIVNN